MHDRGFSILTCLWLFCRLTGSCNSLYHLVMTFSLQGYELYGEIALKKITIIINYFKRAIKTITEKSLIVVVEKQCALMSVILIGDLNDFELLGHCFLYQNEDVSQQV